MPSFDQVQSTFILQNNAPVDVFMGLSANEMHHLLYDSFGDKSPIQFQEQIDNNTLDKIPIFRILEDYLKILQRETFIKLTPLGALPKKVMVELYSKGYLPDDIIEAGITKLSREEDCISIRSARFAAELARLVKKVNGKLSLTKTALKLLETNNRVQLFKLFFQAFTQKFSWSYNDLYPEEPIGQLGWGFSLILLDKFGDHPQTVKFYADKYAKAFPVLLDIFESEHFSREDHFFRCYGIRSFDRFFYWFGLVSVEKKKEILNLENDTFQKTELIKQLFKLDI